MSLSLSAVWVQRFKRLPSQISHIILNRYQTSHKFDSNSKLNCIHPQTDDKVVFLLRNLKELSSQSPIKCNTSVIYPYLDQIFSDDDKSQIFGSHLLSQMIDAHLPTSELLRFVQYTPSTKAGLHFFTNLMTQLSLIHDYQSCQTIFNWIADDQHMTHLLSIKHFNILLSSYRNCITNEDGILCEIWREMYRLPNIVFDDLTIDCFFCSFHSLSEKRSFGQSLVEQYSDILTLHIWIQIIPYLSLNAAFDKYCQLMENIDSMQVLSLETAMIGNICNHRNMNSTQKAKQMFRVLHNSNLAKNEKRLKVFIAQVSNVSEHISLESGILYHCLQSTLVDTKIIKKEITEYDKKSLQLFINALFEICAGNNDPIIFKAHLFDICSQFGDHFSIENWKKLIDILAQQTLNSFNSWMISFLIKTHQKLIKKMSADHILIALQGLKSMDANAVIFRNALFFKQFHLIQERIIDILLTNGQLLNENHTRIIFTFDDITNGILSIMAKYRLYSQVCMRCLGQQLIVNLNALNPKYSLVKISKHKKRVKPLTFTQLTTLLVHLRHLNHYQKRLYSMIARKLQKRSDLISIQDLREWCLSFAYMAHISDSIWLTIQSILMYAFPSSNDIRERMSTEMMIDFIWSMVILDLIPNREWMLNDFLKRINKEIVSDQLSHAHQIRVYEILQALYANNLHSHLLAEIKIDIFKIYAEYYQQSLADVFHEQCQKRSMIVQICHYLNARNIGKYSVGCLVGPMNILCDIVLDEYKVVIEIVDDPQIIARSQERNAQWVKFRGRRQLTNRLLKKDGWNVIVVTVNDFEQGLVHFHLCLDRFVKEKIQMAPDFDEKDLSFA